MVKGYICKFNQEGELVGFIGPGEPNDRRRLSSKERKIKRAKNKQHRKNKKRCRNDR